MKLKRKLRKTDERNKTQNMIADNTFLKKNVQFGTPQHLSSADRAVPLKLK